MTEFNYQKQAQAYYAAAPVIILGSGASMAFGLPGMAELAQFIIDNIDTSSIAEHEAHLWKQFQDSLAEGIDLETALHQVNLSDETTSLIIQAAWDLIEQRNQKVFTLSISDTSMFPLGKILSHMFNSSLPQLDIVTTNYDLLAEYACDQEGLYHYSGFSHGYVQRLAEPSYIRCARKVNIWKVHGSLDWFYTPEGETISIPNSNLRPINYNPQIVTPGVQKYQKTHLEPYRSIISNADSTIVKASSFLCVGFGFNDEHIQPKLIQKCRSESVPITVVTYSLTDKTKELLFDGQIQNYLAIERASDDDHSRIYSSQFDSPIEVEGDFWSLGGFIKLIM